VSYQIFLPQFEGPFDLLLFFIERDEINIYDIPIYKITHDFLHYLRQLESKNIDIAGEFILVAATLMRIKAKMLLPRKELDEQGNEIDPRQELVQQLLEYRRFKSVVDEIRYLEGERIERFSRGTTSKDQNIILQNIMIEGDLETISLYKLMNVFYKVMDRYKYVSTKVEHKVVAFKYSIEDCKKQITDYFTKNSKGKCSAIFSLCEDKLHAVVILLALLEMIQAKLLTLHSSEGYNNFYIEKIIEE
jgi:segregation and condensation protein A